ncbi:MAG: O-methyltransferase [Bacteroidales bacterium]|jgi:predicted O-methyltransferase YrrM|nr:O-methyltransferase [Bacteroidales bacterium]
MMDRIEKYISEHSSGKNPALDWLERQTNLRTRAPRMLSGEIQGRILETFSVLLHPSAILELGTFTGYSAIALSKGLNEDGRLDSIEINDEMAGLISEAWDRAGISNKAHLHIGNAIDVIPGLDFGYELAYIDADKRLYPDYYRLILPKMRQGGYILADNVLWSGKVCEADPPKDRQTSAIMEFNDMVAADPLTENFILPVRDGLNIIRLL